MERENEKVNTNLNWKEQLREQVKEQLKVRKYISRIHLKPINIRWIRTGSHPYENFIQFSMNIKMHNHKIKTSFFSPCFSHLGAKKLVLILQLYVLYPRKAVYNKMQEITIIASQILN